MHIADVSARGAAYLARGAIWWISQYWANRKGCIKSYKLTKAIEMDGKCAGSICCLWIFTLLLYIKVGEQKRAIKNGK